MESIKHFLKKEKSQFHFNLPWKEIREPNELANDSNDRVKRKFKDRSRRELEYDRSSENSLTLGMKSKTTLLRCTIKKEFTLASQKLPLKAFKAIGGRRHLTSSASKRGLSWLTKPEVSRVENSKVAEAFKFKLRCSEKMDEKIKAANQIQMAITFTDGGERSRHKDLVDAKRYFTEKNDMLSLRRQIQHWHFSISIIAMYWNLQGMHLQINKDIERISKEGRQSGQMKCDDWIIKTTRKKRFKKAAKMGEASAAKCCQLKGTKKDTTMGNIKLMQNSLNSSDE